MDKFDKTSLLLGIFLAGMVFGAVLKAYILETGYHTPPDKIYVEMKKCEEDIPRNQVCRIEVVKP